MMTDEEKPGQTPREMIARLADMTNEEFDRFMHGHFNRICKQPPRQNTDKKTPMPWIDAEEGDMS